MQTRFRLFTRSTGRRLSLLLLALTLLISFTGRQNASAQEGIDDFTPISIYSLDNGSIEDSISDPALKTPAGKVFGDPTPTEDRFGNPNGALLFDGVNDYIQTNEDSNFKPLTFSVWFRADDISGEHSIVDSDVSGKYGHSLIIGYDDPADPFDTPRDGSLDVQYHNGFWDTGVKIQPGIWYQAFVTYGDKMRLYLGTQNGQMELVAEQDYPQTEFDGSKFRFGRHNAEDPQWFKGAMDDVRFYDKALDIEEIRKVASLNPCESNVTEAADYRLVYHLAIPVDSNFDSDPVPYDVDNSLDIASYDRVAYCLQLDDQWVWVSMDDFTDDIIAQTGVPVLSANPNGFQQKIDNMTVESNVPGVATGENIDTGNIEFWNNCYFKDAALGLPGASDSTYDFDDTKVQTANYPPSCYGSMQVHNYGAQQTVFAYNQWDDGGNKPASDLGIGNNPSGEPDWTFAANADAYDTRDLWVYVREVAPICEVPDAEGVLRVFADTEEGAALSGVSTVEFIMDGSFSMVDPKNNLKVSQDKDSPRLEVARDAMKQVVNDISDDTNVALRVFGEDGTCSSELTIPAGPLDKGAFADAIDKIDPQWKGKPASYIAGSLGEAVNDLKDVDGQKILVLITDGAENCAPGDEAEKDAAVRAALEKLKAAGIDVRLNIVGFAVADDALKQKFIRWAGILGGNYYDATDAAALSGAIKKALGVPYQVTDEKGQLVAQGTLNGSHKLPTGQYTVRVLTDPPIKVSVSVFGGQVTKVGVQP